MNDSKYIGTRQGKLVVKDMIQRGERTVFVCLCDCGRIKEVSYSCIQGGHAKSCGCLRSKMLSDRRRKAPGEATTAMVKAHYTGGAKKRGYTWELTDDEFKKLIFQNCYYCGSEPKNVRKQVPSTDPEWREMSKTIYNGIDRIDNSIGYTLDNSVTCCKTCNYAKNKMHRDEFLNWVDQIARHNGYKKG